MTQCESATTKAKAKQKKLLEKQKEDREEEEKRHKERKEWFESAFPKANEEVAKEIEDIEKKIKDEIAEHALKLEEVSGAMAKNIFPEVATVIGGSAAKAVATSVKAEIMPVSVAEIKGQLLEEKEVMLLFGTKRYRPTRQA